MAIWQDYGVENLLKTKVEIKIKWNINYFQFTKKSYSNPN